MTIFEKFSLIENPINQTPMAKYMRNQFPFAGLKAPERKQQSHDLIQASKKLRISEILSGVTQLYQRPQREYQYVAIDMCVANVRRLSFADITHLTRYITEKSWWDTVDTWRKVFGLYIMRHPEQKQAVFALFYQNANMWMRRVSIILQLTEKETLDTLLLTKAIENDLNTDEFFIQKAIGWALRNYSKMDPEWVKRFIQTHQLSKLARHEGAKYLTGVSN
ncbi:6-O-methylguanine DNA methyltransferase [Secundilactobacillus paracollinoides]|uniref:6-O-methylguanine DNA methyltransferase n=1 Tax=Secundilactobacillus paracollinoides TaxID=240427 RepID=A0A1B2IVW6_9LACO|nr:DNA alkylation repair protein [Secundilactobacillus paracollinoides]ANZ60353.1 6-O-methylguanine DNA methyltransferase [Secundilactobacillus paracollinoides]ANZ62658.1 6-O-methylguanine DNA methyltransferase [Secundilactobacillus paracollinoides]ANZ66182.1 6-O-methylguanine DNA methyltransferase [Secundilactobacillus paracollinoides]KRL75077.1 DNA alkylation repair enzyme [Secundilactobacillus paracollinoides DSM 15502 = JCM 11969]